MQLEPASDAVRHREMDDTPYGRDVPKRDPDITIGVVVEVLQTGGVTPVTTADTASNATEYTALPTPAGVCTFTLPAAALVTHCNSVFACREIHDRNQPAIQYSN